MSRPPTRPAPVATNPWYREPWPWIVMIAPGVAVVSGAALLWLAISSDDGLVSGDYYRQGLAINQVLRRDERAAELGYHASALLSEDNERVQVTLRGAPGSSLPGILNLRLAHPTRAGLDQIAVLHARSPGRYEARILPPQTGRWRVSIEDHSGTWRLAGVWLLPQDRGIELKASTTSSDGKR